VTVVGDAGIGKTRLANELVARLAGPARVLTGRCLPYGDGIKFWPVVEVLRGAAGIAASDPAQALGKVSTLLPPGHVSELVMARLGGLLGDGGAQPAVQELFSAIRKLLELLATTGPLVVLFDDIHWGEPTFLQLLEYLANSTGRAPLLVVCLARGELLDERPDWATPRANAEIVSLRPLTAEETRQLREIGEMTWFSTVAGLLGEAVLQAGRRDEAEVLAEASRDVAAPDDVDAQAIWRTVASTVHASSGRAESAEALTQERWT
jgi:predicted ATPase